jgi:cadherin EGF LAG seven-pass G-type receptor 1
MQLSVLLVTDAMLFNSVTLRLGDMDQESFLSQPLYNYFVDGLAAIIPCPKENVFVFNIQVHTYINTMDTFSSCLSGCKKKPQKV